MSAEPSIDTAITKFIAVSDQLCSKYASHLEDWKGSPFEWIMSLPSRTKGAVGEQLVEQWLMTNGHRIERPPHSGCDRIVNGVNVEIKFSTLWKSGGYTFQQLRDQDYAFVFFLGISPNMAHAWFIPKHVAWSHAIPQHGGKDGTDTRWLSFPAAEPPAWLADHGGTLDRALKLLERAELWK